MTRTSQPPRFFLEPGSAPDAPVLLPADAAHAITVLRLGPGDRIQGLDGRGSAWPLVISSLGRRNLELEILGPPTTAPAPGTPGAALPELELALSWPRPQRAEALIDRLTQLGVARIQPLLTARSGPHGSPGQGRLERLLRVAQSACKQSGRLWLPEIAPPAALADLLATTRPSGTAPHPGAVLTPGAPRSLGDWARSLPRPPGLRILLGPEGGLESAEEEQAAAAGLTPVALAPHVLRVEAAAESAAAVLADAFLRHSD
ncbi:MAG: RsmE family RNA methyltransferase [Planctomycetota bacterium]|nr:RsmE family RNA methyltransferase [Planctomycetota bacterium]MDP6838586.1 RsmE family RNA methyltransferase [Planctomycetota bacterium]